jgi:hypothetical protein
VPSYGGFDPNWVVFLDASTLTQLAISQKQGLDLS